MLSIFTILFLTNCGGGHAAPGDYGGGTTENGKGGEHTDTQIHLTTSHHVRDITNHPAFEGFGELLLTRDDNSSSYDVTLSGVGALMPYHGNVRPDVVVEALNRMIDEVRDGRTLFYDIYTEQQKQQGPTKRNTGIFFFRGQPDAPFAVICPGGGFSYVGSLHEGFPLAQRILVYTYTTRPGRHDWAFWQEYLPKALKLASDNFN